MLDSFLPGEVSRRITSEWWSGRYSYKCKLGFKALDDLEDEYGGLVPGSSLIISAQKLVKNKIFGSSLDLLRQRWAKPPADWEAHNGDHLTHWLFFIPISRDKKIPGEQCKWPFREKASTEGTEQQRRHREQRGGMSVRRNRRERFWEKYLLSTLIMRTTLNYNSYGAYIILYIIFILL